MEYDAESLTGLMPQILALTAPPGSRDSKSQMPFHSTYISTKGNDKSNEAAGLAAHPYFKRPGKGHNRDSCDSCAEGGDLICCDVCPASFHLTCHDPPLEEDSIPHGDWVCHQCKVGKIEDSGAPSSYSMLYKFSKASNCSDEEVQEANVLSGGRKMSVSNSPLSLLVKAAASINPKQFQLPFELPTPANFPGESKDAGKRHKKHQGRKRSHENDINVHHNSCKLCYNCHKTNRIGALVSCDFCPLVYHMDCLDPPLVTPPMGRWQCPNHVEMYMDAHLLTSHSYTERVKLWQSVSGPMDQNTIKLEFLRNVHRRQPNAFKKARRALRKRVKIPPAVVGYYKDRASLLPMKTEQLAYHLPTPAYNTLENSKENVEPQQPVSGPSTEEQEQFIAAITALTSSSPKAKSNEDHTTTAATTVDAKPSTPPHNLQPSQNASDTTPQVPGVTTMDPFTVNNIDTEDDVNMLASDIKPDLGALERDVPAHAIFLSKKSGIVMPKFAARAMLQPLIPNDDITPVSTRDNQSRVPVLMYFRNLTIGRGSQNNVDLRTFGNCNFISDMHAVIFYDEATCNYELLNYSRHGSTVDELMYGVDCSKKSISKPSLPPAIEQAKAIIRNAKSNLVQDEPTMNSTPGMVLNRCNCHQNARNRRNNSWEGTAQIQHGSFLKFGCMSFVFCVLEEAINGNWLEDTATVYEQLLEKEMKSDRSTSSMDTL